MKSQVEYLRRKKSKYVIPCLFHFPVKDVEKKKKGKIDATIKLQAYSLVLIMYGLILDYKVVNRDRCRTFLTILQDSVHKIAYI